MSKEVAKLITHCPVCGAELPFECYDDDPFIFCNECYAREHANGPKLSHLDDYEDIEASGCETCGNYDTTYPDCQYSCPMFDD